MIESLIRQLHSPDPAVRKRAILAVGRAKNPAAVKHLAFIVKHDPDPELRDLARKAGQYIRQQISQQTRPHAPLPATAVLKRRIDESRGETPPSSDETSDEFPESASGEPSAPAASTPRPRSMLDALNDPTLRMPRATPQTDQAARSNDVSEETRVSRPLTPSDQVDELFREFGTQMLGQRPTNESSPAQVDPPDEAAIEDLVDRLLTEFGTGTLVPPPELEEPAAHEPPPEQHPAAHPVEELLEDFTRPTLTNQFQPPQEQSEDLPAPEYDADFFTESPEDDAVDELLAGFSAATLLQNQRPSHDLPSADDQAFSDSVDDLFEDFSKQTFMDTRHAEPSTDPLDDLFEDFSKQTLMDARHTEPSNDPVDDLFDDFSKQTLMDTRHTEPSNDPVDDLFDDFSKQTLMDARHSASADDFEVAATHDPVDDLFEDFSKQTLMDARYAEPSNDPVDDLFEDFSKQTLMDARYAEPSNDPVDDLFEDFSKQTLMDARHAEPSNDPVDDLFEDFTRPTIVDIPRPPRAQPVEDHAHDASADDPVDDLFEDFSKQTLMDIPRPANSSPFVVSPEEDEPDFALAAGWLADDPLATVTQDDDPLAEILHLNDDSPSAPAVSPPLFTEPVETYDHAPVESPSPEANPDDDEQIEPEPPFTLHVERNVPSNFTPYVSPFTSATEDDPLETDYYQHIEVDLFPEPIPEPDDLSLNDTPEPITFTIDEKPAPVAPSNDEYTLVRGHSFDIPKEDQARAKAYLNAAMSLNISGDNARALKNLTSALGLNPNLINDGYFNNVAEAVTGLTGDKAAQVIIDRTRRSDFTKNAELAQKARRKQAHVDTAKKATWTDVWFEVVIYSLIVIIGPVLAVLVTVESARNLLGSFSEVSSELPAQLQNAQTLSEAFSLSSLLPIGIVSGISGVISLLLLTVLLHFVAKLLGGAGTWRNLIRILLGFFNKWLPILFFLLYITIAVTFISLLSPIILCFVLVLVGLSLYVSVKTAGKIGEAYDFGAGKGCLAYLISLLVIGLVNGGIYFVLGQSFITALSAVAT